MKNPPLSNHSPSPFSRTAPSRSRSGLTALVGGLAFCSLLAPAASAALLFWTDAGPGSNYTTPANWDQGFVPGPADLAVHNNGNVGPIVITSDVAADSLRLSDGGAVQHNAGLLTVQTEVGSDQGLWIGEFGPRASSYIMTGGAIVLNDDANSFDVGRGGSAEGIFTMSAGTITNNGVNDAFFVGRFGGSIGTFNFTGGTINGPAGDTHIGLDGTATWNQSGGTFNAAGVHIGRFQSPTAVVNLSGNAAWNAGLVLLADASASFVPAIRAELNVVGPNVDFNSNGLVVRQKGVVRFDGDGIGISSLDLGGGQLLLDQASLVVNNLPAGNEEVVLFTNIGSFTGNAAFANAPQGGVVSDGWVIDYRADQIVLQPDPSAVLLQIVRQPSDRVVWTGEPVEFVAEVASSLPTQLKWEVSTNAGQTWTAIPGATSATYSIASATLALNGNQYRMVATRQDGIVRSSRAAVLQVGDPAQAPSPRAVVAHYRFSGGSDGATAASAQDSSGNGHHMGVVGQPRFSSSVPAGRLPQTGVTNELSADLIGGEHAFAGEDGDALSQVVWNDFTIEAWVRFADAGAWQTIVGRDDRGNQNNNPLALFRFEKDDLNHFRVAATGRNGELHIVTTNFTVTPDQWIHLAVVGNTQNRTLTAYGNGRVVGIVQDFRGLMIPRPATRWTIGRGQWAGVAADWANGRIDEVRFSAAALAPQEFLNFPHAALNIFQPPANVTVATGSAATFTVTAGGGGASSLTYQWQVSQDGGGTWTNIAGATGASFTKTSAGLPDSGNLYRVSVSGGGKTVVSAPAALTVTALPAPVVVRGLGGAQLAFAGQTHSFSVEATGVGPLTYQWQRDGTNIPNATQSTLDLGVVGFGSAGQYSVTISDPAAAGGSAVTLHTLLMVSPSSAGAVSLNFAGAAAADAPDYSQERGLLDPLDVAGLVPVANWNNAPAEATRSTPFTLVNDLGENTNISATWSGSNFFASRRIGGALAEKEGTQRLFHGYLESREGSTVTISGIPYASYDVYVYPVGMEGAPGEFVRRVSVQSAGGGEMNLYGSNFGGFTAPRERPMHLAIAASAEEAVELPPATVFWFPGMSGSSVTITHMDAIGDNLGGIAGISIVNTSPNAAPRPVFLSRPSGRFLPAGQSASLSVSALSPNNGSLAYQWRRNGTNIPGATSATLNLSNVSPADSGLYSVRVTSQSAAGTSFNEASASLVVASAGSPVLISADMNVGPHAHMAGHGVLRPDGISLQNIGEGATQWTRLAEGLMEPLYRRFVDAGGRRVAGMTFTVTGASGRHDQPEGGGIDIPVDAFSGPLLRDYLYTAKDGVMTMTVGGLNAFAGREAKLVVYALGRDSKSWPMANSQTNAAQNDVATVTLAAQNSPTGVSVSGTTDQAEGRDLRYNDKAFVAFDVVIAPNGTLTWTVGPAPEPGLNAFNGFQLLVTDGGTPPPSSGIDAWRMTHFGTTDATGSAALTADPDGDGFPNLLEYALGKNPKKAGDALGAIALGRANGFLTLRFPHVADPKLVYEVQASADLVNWSTVATYTFDAAGQYTHQDTVTQANQPRRFLRLQVRLAP